MLEVPIHPISLHRRAGDCGVQEDTMTIKEYVLKKTTPQTCQKVLSEILDRYLDPAFGSLTKKEADLLMIDALEDINFISYDPTLYEIETKLRITRFKARSLIYENELRDPHDLDRRVKAALINPILQKDGEFFYLEVENPLVQDHLRAKLHELNFTADGSFSPSLIKLSLKAFAALISHYMDKSEREEVRKELVAAGAPDTSVQGVLKAVLKALALKYAQEEGSAIVEKVSEYISPILGGSIGTMKGHFKELLAILAQNTNKNPAKQKKKGK